MSSVYIFVLGRLVFLETGVLCSIVMQVHAHTRTCEHGVLYPNKNLTLFCNTHSDQSSYPEVNMGYILFKITDHQH